MGWDHKPHPNLWAAFRKCSHPRPPVYLGIQICTEAISSPSLPPSSIKLSPGRALLIHITLLGSLGVAYKWRVQRIRIIARSTRKQGHWCCASVCCHWCYMLRSKHKSLAHQADRKALLSRNSREFELAVWVWASEAWCWFSLSLSLSLGSVPKPFIDDAEIPHDVTVSGW